MAEEREEALIAYCGLDCSRCFGYKKTISEAAKELRRTMRKERMKEAWAGMPFLGDYASFKKSLDALAGLGCRGCREGGGNPWCKIRTRCRKRGYESCAQCDEFQQCEKLTILVPYHKDEHLKNLRRLKKVGVSRP